MKATANTIKCPEKDCSGDISIELNQLIAGAKFTCDTCKSSIGIAADSRAVVKDAYNEFLKINS